jgi:hypothetical protein
MSSALASAKKKRAPPESVQPQNNRTPNFSQSGANGQISSAAPMPIGSVITILNNRLSYVETKMKDILQGSAGSLSLTTQLTQSSSLKQDENHEAIVVPSNLTETLSDYEARFDILAEEIANIKNIVLSLQSYTMEVNKMLLEERIHLLSSTDNRLDEFTKKNDISLDAEDGDIECTNTNVEELQLKLSSTMNM